MLLPHFLVQCVACEHGRAVFLMRPKQWVDAIARTKRHWKLEAPSFAIHQGVEIVHETPNRSSKQL